MDSRKETPGRRELELKPPGSGCENACLCVLCLRVGEKKVKIGQISEDVRCLVERLVCVRHPNRFWEEERTGTYLVCQRIKG